MFITIDFTSEACRESVIQAAYRARRCGLGDTVHGFDAENPARDFFITRDGDLLKAAPDHHDCESHWEPDDSMKGKV